MTAYENGDCPPPHSAVVVLSIQELLMSILVQLPVQDLLLVQRVCKGWYALIKFARPLQEALFLRPQQRRLGSGLPRSKNDFRRNPLLEEHFGPLLRISKHQGNFITSKHVSQMPWTQIPRVRAMFLRADASWRKMLVVQPCVESFETRLIFEGNVYAADETTTDVGLRMGWLYDRFVDAVLSVPGDFALRWHMQKTKRLWSNRLTVVSRHNVYQDLDSNRPYNQTRPFHSLGYGPTTHNIYDARKHLQALPRLKISTFWNNQDFEFEIDHHSACQGPLENDDDLDL